MNSSAALKHAQCPICISTIQSPSRMLNCGHNFCGSCLERLCAGGGTQYRCPVCRKLFSLPNGVNVLPQNFALENMMEEIQNTPNEQPSEPSTSNPPSSTPSAVLSGSMLLQLKGKGNAYMDKEQYQKALHAFQTVIDDETGVSQILTLIKKVHCLIALNNMDDVVITTNQLAALVKFSSETEELQQISGQCDIEIKNLMVKFIDTNHTRLALILLDCWFVLVKQFYREELRMIKLGNIGRFMYAISKTMALQNRKQDFVNHHSFMDEVGSEIRKLRDVTIDEKCMTVASFLNIYGECCTTVDDYTKSLDLFMEAIHTAELIADGADQRKLLISSYAYQGSVYEKLQKRGEAEKSFKKAKEILEQFSQSEVTE